MLKALNLTDQKFGRLTAIYPTTKRSIDRGVVWMCLCECGNTAEVSARNLRRKHRKSCGCLHHGFYKHPLCGIWSKAKTRCYNSNTWNFKNYGGRGITVCDEWKDNPKAFIEWALSHGWEKGLQIDRRNNDGPYAPWNCRFIGPIGQANNTRKLKLFIAYGPCGQIEIAKSQAVFARKWKLCKYGLSACLRGRQKSASKWTFEYLKRI